MENPNNLPVKSEFYHQVVTPPEGSTALRNFLRIIFRQKFYIIGFFLITFVPTAIYAFLAPKVYQSEAKIFIQLGRENMSVDPSVVGPMSGIRSDRQSEINSEVSALKSRILAEKTVEQLGPYAILNTTKEDVKQGRQNQSSGYIKGLLSKLGLKTAVPLDEVAVIELAKNLSVSAENNSHIIFMSYQAKSPELAQNILNVMIDRYRDRHIEMHRAQAPLKYIEKNAAELRATLEDKEAQLKAFLERNAISSLDAQKNDVLEQVSILQKEIDQGESLAGATRAKISSIQRSLQGRSPSRELNRVVGRPNRAVDAIKERLFELRSQEADLSAHYPDTDRGLIDLREKIRLAEEQLSRESETLTEITQGVDTNYQTLQLNLANERAQLQALNARKEILKGQLQERNAELSKLSSYETNLISLKREVDIANAEYQRYRENLQRAKIYADLDSSRISNVSVVQPPSFSQIPIKPRRSLYLLVGFLLGITGGLCVAFMREYFDSTIKATDDVEEKLGIPVLVSISREEFRACT